MPSCFSFTLLSLRALPHLRRPHVSENFVSTLLSKEPDLKQSFDSGQRVSSLFKKEYHRPTKILSLSFRCLKWPTTRTFHAWILFKEQVHLDRLAQAQALNLQKLVAQDVSKPILHPYVTQELSVFYFQMAERKIKRKVFVAWENISNLNFHT